MFVLYIAVFRHIDDMTFIHTDVGNNRQRRNAVVNPSYLWSDGIIPYIISNIFKGKKIDKSSISYV